MRRFIMHSIAEVSYLSQPLKHLVYHEFDLLPPKPAGTLTHDALLTLEWPSPLKHLIRSATLYWLFLRLLSMHSV
jgi:hypothetical protein